MSNNKEIVYVTNNKGRTLFGYDSERYAKFKESLAKSGYREATKQEIEAKKGILEPVKAADQPQTKAAKQTPKNKTEVDEKISEPTETEINSETSKIE